MVLQEAQTMHTHQDIDTNQCDPIKTKPKQIVTYFILNCLLIHHFLNFQIIIKLSLNSYFTTNILETNLEPWTLGMFESVLIPCYEYGLSIMKSKQNTLETKMEFRLCVTTTSKSILLYYDH